MAGDNYPSNGRRFEDCDTLWSARVCSSGKDEDSETGSEVDSRKRL